MLMSQVALMVVLRCIWEVLQKEEVKANPNNPQRTKRPLRNQLRRYQLQKNQLLQRNQKPLQRKQKCLQSLLIRKLHLKPLRKSQKLKPKQLKLQLEYSKRNSRKCLNHRNLKRQAHNLIQSLRTLMGLLIRVRLRPQVRLRPRVRLRPWVRPRSQVHQTHRNSHKSQRLRSLFYKE